MRTKVVVDVRASAKTVEEDITAGKPFLVSNHCSKMLIAATTSLELLKSHINLRISSTSIEGAAPMFVPRECC
jgi:hypothetical protein